nr:ubiquitin hydrolase [Tanacetum cinerariifolium]
MMKKSSSSENEPCCSKACKKNTDNLNSKITELSDKLNGKVNMIYHYSLGLLTASKDLDNLIESQRLDKNKEGLGYSAVPPSIPQIYSSPKKDLSWTGLPEFADNTVIDYSRPSPTVEIKFMKAAERSTTNKVETVKKPSVRYAKLYIKPSKKSTVRGNQRNWNNLKSQQLGKNFVRKNRACFNCGHFDHLAYDCRLGVKRGRKCPTYTHKSMPPRPATHRPYIPPMRPNMNSARPNKPAHSYGRRPFQETTQELMIILIQRVQRLERELKARTPIHKVDRGRSRLVMAWVPKKV